MPRIMTMLVLVLSLIGTIGLTGCTTQDEYDRLYETNRSLEQQIRELRKQLDEVTGQRDALQARLTATEQTLAALQRQNADLMAQLDAANRQLAALGGELGNIRLRELDPDTDRLLSELARQFPDLLEYDPATGMIRFKSDVLFDSGSDVVKEAAKPALGALARIMQSPSASAYEVYVVGHTDAQRISANTAQRHPTNRHLSAHRSISVIRELANLGASNEKLMIAGWGEFKPRVPNTSSNGNTPENRRVEFYFTRPRMGAAAASGSSVTPASTSLPAERSGTPTRQPDISK